MDTIIAWVASQYIGVDWAKTVGLIAIIAYAIDSIYLAYSPQLPANNTLQRLAPLFLALGKRLAPPMAIASVDQCIALLKSTAPLPDEPKPTNAEVLTQITETTQEAG